MNIRQQFREVRVLNLVPILRETTKPGILGISFYKQVDETEEKPLSKHKMGGRCAILSMKI